MQQQFQVCDSEDQVLAASGADFDICSKQINNT